MGRGTWDATEWSTTRLHYSKSAKPTVDHIYKSRSLCPDLDAASITLRESRDSAANPNSTALIVAQDVTGSMTAVLDVMAREGLGTLVGQIYERKPISDPHIMIMGVDDFEVDSPLQVTQFEAENKPLVEQLERIWLVRRGGGNNYESYAAAWLFAAARTSIDCFEKRGKRGYLFTIGDECPTPVLRRDQIKRFMGIDQDRDIEGPRALEMAQATYNVFHVVVEEGDYASRNLDRVYDEWRRLLGQNVLPLSDHRKVAEVIVSAIQVAEGQDRDVVARSWSGDTSLVVARAIHDVARGTNVSGGGAMKLDY